MLTGTYLYLKFECYIKGILKNYGVYQNLLFLYIPPIVMFRGFTNTKISSNHRLLSLTNLSLLFYQPHTFWGNIFPLSFSWRINRTPTPITFISWGKSRWLIKTTCFVSVSLQTEPVIIKTINFKFQNVSFTKLRLITHGTNNVIINLKWRKCIQTISQGKYDIYKIQSGF